MIHTTAAQRNDKITVYGKGDQTRTFCYIDDNIYATLKCLLENEYINDVVNIGNDVQITILELAELIIKTTKSKSEIEYLPPLPEGDMSRRQPDIGKMKKLLDRDLLPLEDGLKILLEKGMF